MNLLSRRPFLSLSRKREASVALECETEMNFEGPPVKAVPEPVRKRPTRQSIQSSTRIHEKQSAAATRRNASTTNGDLVWSTEVYDAISDPELDAVHAWKPRDRVITGEMEHYLARKSEDVLVKEGDLEAYLSCPTDVEGIINLLAWKACDHRGRKRFVSNKIRESCGKCKAACDAARKTGCGLTGVPTRRDVFATNGDPPANAPAGGRRDGGGRTEERSGIYSWKAERAARPAQ